MTTAFEAMCLNPFQEIANKNEEFALIERFAYEALNVITLREELFTNRPLENLPPTKAALLQHTKRAIYHASIGASSTNPIIGVPVLCNWGWTFTSDSGKP